MAVRPKPAATIIALWDDENGTRHLLMGKRGDSLRFLPGFLVFPGGRLEPEDWMEPSGTDQARPGLEPGHRPVLDREFRDGSVRKGRYVTPADAYVRAALRECLEETGILLAEAIQDPLRYVGRAITPPHLPVRFDTRFFVATVSHQPKPQGQEDGELLRTGWRTLREIGEEKVHHVTRTMMTHALAVHDGLETAPLLVADRTPKRWQGRPALRSRDLRAAMSDQA